MAEWLRETPWRQGHLLTKDSMLLLFPDAVHDGFDVALVISHDCDLAQLPEAEPAVELILGTEVERLDGNYSYAKSARRLHLSFTGTDVGRVVDATARQRVTIPKAQLAEHDPDGSTRLTAEEHSILQRWLAARYSRSAFPDEFDGRLADAGVPDGLAKILKPLNSVIVAMYFDVDKGAERDHQGEDDPYVLIVATI